MNIKFQNLIPMLCGSFGLPSVDGDLALTKHPIYLVLLQASTLVCNFQTKMHMECKKHTHYHHAPVEDVSKILGHGSNSSAAVGATMV